MFLIVSLICLLGAIILLADFFFWFFTGEVVPSTIEEFRPGKRGWGSVPVLKFETLDAQVITTQAEQVTHIGYYLTSPQPGDIFNAIYKKGQPERARLFGNLQLVAAGFLSMPFLAWLANDRLMMTSQVYFSFIFAMIMMGGWVAMKLIRRHY